jgi:hypothetical protein
MKKPLNPSSWLLLDEPDLTPDQVWAVPVFAGKSIFGNQVYRTKVVIADTADQAMKAMADFWPPLVALCETTLNAQIALAETGPVRRSHNYSGLIGTHRFMCIFATKDPTDPYRMMWIRTASRQAAFDAWRQLGENQKPFMVIELFGLKLLRDEVRQVRLNRGNGTVTDGREWLNRMDERWIPLQQDKRGQFVYWHSHPDRTPETDDTPFDQWVAEVRALGKADCEARVKDLVAIEVRARAMRKVAQTEVAPG